MRVNAQGEFEDDSPPKRTEVRTDAEKRAEAIRKLKAAGYRFCDVCGKPFISMQPNQKRCGEWECKVEANRRRNRENARRKAKHG